MKQLLVRYSLHFASLAVLAVPAAAQDQLVSGTVVDAASQQPINGAYVTITGSALPVRTDANGASGDQPRGGEQAGVLQGSSPAVFLADIARKP